MAIAWLQHETQVVTALAQHSDEVLARVKDFDKASTDVSTAGSSYIFGGDPRQLSKYRKTLPTMNAQLDALRRLVADNPAQVRRVDALRRSTNDGIAVMNRYVALAQRKDRAGLNRLIVSQLKVPRKNTALEKQLQFEDAETQLKQQRLRRESELWRDLDWLLALAGLLAIVFTISVNSAFGRQIVDRLQSLSRNVRRFSEGQPFHPEVGGDDEITDLERAYGEMVLRVRESAGALARYHLLAQHSRDIMLFVDRSTGRVIEANEAACAAYGYTHEELAAISAFDLRAPEERVEARNNFDRHEGRDALFEATHVRKDGSSFPVEVSVQSADLDGQAVMLCVLRDITERRRTQKAIESALRQATEGSRLKSEFVATMSHEIRTPMNGVIGTTDLLLRTDLNAQQREYASTIRDSGNALLRVINDILDFSKIEAGKEELEYQEFDVVRLVESVAAVLMPTAHEKHLALMTFVDPASPARLIGDEHRLRQILLNLAGNAIKFTETGTVVISATLRSQTDSHARMDFAVSDTGVGLSSHSLAGLFEPFRQVDGSNTRKYGGTGLGLSIAQRLVGLMGSSIAVQSELGKGSTFEFGIDLAVAAPARALPIPAKQVRVLIVDDDPISCDIISQYVSRWNMQYEVAVDPREVMRRLDLAHRENAAFDLAIVDQSMPHIDGFALAEKIRSDPRFDPMRLMLVTAFDKPAQAARASSAGFVAYLVKPIKQSQLYDCIVNADAAGGGATTGDSPPDGSPETPGTALRILVAEDNSINRQLALQQLAALGYAAEAVADGRKAVDLGAAGDYDVILMDCQMPEMDGFEATRAIRKLEARSGRRVRIVAMTANALSSDRLRCFDAGMDDYISKPVTLDRLKSALEAASASLTAAQPDGRPDAESHRPPETLDLPRLEQIFGDDRAAIAAFLQSALDTLAELVARLERCDDDEAARPLVHEIKGAAGNLGAEALAAAAAKVERGLAGTGEFDPASLRPLQRAMEHLSVAIDDYDGASA